MCAVFTIRAGVRGGFLVSFNRLAWFRPGNRSLDDKHVQNKGDIFIQPSEKKDDKSLSEKLIAFLNSLTLFFVWGFLFMMVVCGSLVAAYMLGVFRAGHDFDGFDAPRIRWGTGVHISEKVFDEWTASARKSQVIDRKIGSISLADSLIGDPSDHIFLGIYERDVLKRKSEAALHFYLAAANGHPDGYRLYKSLNIPTEDYEMLYQRFVDLHQLNGDLGLERLGQYYLGKDVFRIARRMRTQLRFDEPNDYIWPRQSEAENLAYVQFHMAALCGLTSAFEWRGETARYYHFTEQRENTLKQRGNNELSDLAKRYASGRNLGKRDARDVYCQRDFLHDRIEEMRDYYLSQVGVRHEEDLEGWDQPGSPCDYPDHGYSDEECDAFDDALANGGISTVAVVPTFKDLVEGIRGGPGGGGGSGWPRGGKGGGGVGPRDASSPVYRDNPGGLSTRHMDSLAADGLPDDCVGLDAGEECADRADALACDDRSKREFNMGEADMAVGRTLNARKRFERAIAIGRQCQSEYAVLSGKRIAALNLTCEYSAASLARISRGYVNNPDGGAIIDLPSRQRALRAKGYYEGNIDGKYGPGTRAAVRRFQREFGFNESGELSPVETVYLICSAVENHADIKSMNTLGVMYIAGLGVVQNTDRGVREFTRAAERGNTDAMFNLALIYGTDVIASSFRLCDIVENLQIADSWLEQAAAGGHAAAIRLISMFGQYGPTERWERIKQELQLNDFYVGRLEMVGEACRPNP